MVRILPNWEEQCIHFNLQGRHSLWVLEMVCHKTRFSQQTLIRGECK